MQASKRIKSLLSYLPLLTMLVVAATGIWIARDLYQASQAAQVQNPPASEQGNLPPPRQGNLPPAEQVDPELLVFPGDLDSCISPLIYTSLPPKCRTLEGKFIQLPGTSPRIFLVPATPEGK